MVSATVPGKRRLPGRLRVLSGRFLAARAAAAGRLLRPARPALANLASMPLTAAGLGLFDYGVFRLGVTAGVMVTAGSLVLLEHLIADEA
jgi:hypothetical protein